MRVTLPLDEMTPEEKIEVMEALWQSLAKQPDQVESPAWHKDVLDQRRKEAEAGDAAFIDWEEAQKEIRRRTS